MPMAVTESPRLVAVSTTFRTLFTMKPDGIGMGLSISRSIVGSHRGHLWAAENSPRGAKFYVALPTGVETLTNDGDGEEGRVEPVGSAL